MRVRRLHASLQIAAIALAISSAAADEAAKPPRPKQHTGPVAFLAISDLEYDTTVPALGGATPANPKDFQASFYALSSDGACTSTLVGPRVLLTAAHCVENGGTVSLQRGGKNWVGTCTHAPDYAANDTADWALCDLTGEVAGVPYERVNQDAALLAGKGTLQLSGFGCTKSDGTGGNDGVYRIGNAPIVALPSGTDNDIVTRSSVFLCFGDSGGPAFRYLDPQRTKRVQVGVNSRGNIKDTSYLSSTSTAPAKKFLGDWSEAKKLKICGLHADAPNCHP